MCSVDFATFRGQRPEHSRRREALAVPGGELVGTADEVGDAGGAPIPA